MSELLNIAHTVIDHSLSCGADQVKVSLSKSRGVDLEWREGQIERIQDQTDQHLSISLFVAKD